MNNSRNLPIAQAWEQRGGDQRGEGGHQKKETKETREFAPQQKGIQHIRKNAKKSSKDKNARGDLKKKEKKKGCLDEKKGKKHPVKEKKKE